MKKNVSAILYAVAAAVFYALNIPLSKILLRQVSAVSMAAFLYLGAGIGVGILFLFHRSKETAADRLTRADLPYTLGMIALDVAAPILLMLGVSRMDAAGASLLGNFEIVATALIALTMFHERVSGLLWAAIALITLSGCLLSFEDGSAQKLSAGAVFVLLATVCWGLENNCTRKLSARSTYRIVTVKGIFSGLGALIVALIAREPLPEPVCIPQAMLLGFVSYGLSIFTYIRAQRTLGAAKTSAYYAIAPFVGTFLSFLLLHESLGKRYFIALGIMLSGSAFAVWDTIKKEKKHETGTAAER